MGRLQYRAHVTHFIMTVLLTIFLAFKYIQRRIPDSKCFKSVHHKTSRESEHDLSTRFLLSMAI